MENFKKKALTKEEAKMVLGGVRDPNSPSCPDGAHIFTCYYGTDRIEYCVQAGATDPTCPPSYPGWPAGPTGSL